MLKSDKKVIETSPEFLKGLRFRGATLLSIGRSPFFVVEDALSCRRCRPGTL